MVSTAPLRLLMDIHIKEALSLGLISLPPDEIGVLSTELDKLWATSPEDLKAFSRGVNHVSGYADSVTWLEFDEKEEVTVHRVAPVADIEYPLKGTIGAAGKRIEATRKQLSATLLAIKACAPGADDAKQSQLEKQLRIYFEDIRGHLCHLPSRYPSAKVKAASLHSTWTKAWVVPDTGTDSAMSSFGAQKIRDSLGLVHYPQRGEPTDICQSLVHMSFTAHISDTRLPSRSSPDFLAKQSKGQWLIRPTICHGPNERFCQRHEDDSIGNPAKHGRTIDISTDAYQYGFPELILLHGDDAELTWLDLKLLTPAPISRILDQDHLGFLRSVASRLGYTFP